MKLLASAPVMLWIALPAAALAQFSLESHEATQGKTVNIKSAAPLAGEYTVKLTPLAGGAAISLKPSLQKPATLSVPLTTESVPPNTYTLSVVSGENAASAGTLTVYAPEDPQISKKLELPEITRGQQVVIRGTNFVAGAYSVYLSTSALNPQDGIRLEALASDKERLTFTLSPDKVQPGRYVVWVSVGEKFYPVPGHLGVLPDAQAPVSLDALNPITVYPSDRAGLDFEISGKNLGNPASNNLLMVVDRGLVTTGTPEECKAAKESGKYEKTCLEVEPGMETRKLRVLGFKRSKYDGPIRIKVLVGNNESNALPLTFSRITERGVLWGALAIFLAVMAIVVRLAWKGIGEATIGQKSYSPWHGFFLDKETNTYSLSKFQLLTWTAVFIFGYLYLFLCRMLIQWKFELPPVPDGLPGMLAISAGTAVAAAGATETRGSKGSGAIHPSAADFISTGGLVVGERFQFFVWTLVGAFGFVAMLLLTDPAKLVELPKIPDNFLYVMGISSVGYLAGKLTRKPGPVIRSLVISDVGPAPAPAGPAGAPPPVAPPPPDPAVTRTQMAIKVVGQNLANNATVKVDDKELRITDQYTLTGTKPQDQAPDPAFCSELQLLLLDAEGYLEGPHTLTLTNRDGQAASATFPIDPMGIDSASFNDDRTTITATGKNFSEGISAQFKSDAGPTTDAQKVTWDKSEPTKLVVTFATAQKPPGVLVLTSPARLRATMRML